MSRLFAGRDSATGRTVAIKKPLDAGTLSESDVEPADSVHRGIQSARRIRQEALVLARLQHPSIVTLYDSNIAETDDPFLVLEWLHGRTLRDIVLAPKFESCPWWERADLLRRLTSVAEALSEAHLAQIVHRDVNPSNIVMGTRGQATVIDWGIAEAMGHDNDGSHTPEYAAPEQETASTVEPAVDVYAFGATLFHVVRGVSHRSRDLELLDDGLDCVPEEVAFIVRRCLSGADERPSMAQVAAWLRQYFSGQAVEGHRYSARARLMGTARRHPVATTLMAFVVAITVPTALIYFELQKREARALAASASARAMKLEAAENELRKKAQLDVDEAIREGERMVRNQMQRALAEEIGRLRQQKSGNHATITALEDLQEENARRIAQLGSQKKDLGITSGELDRQLREHRAALHDAGIVVADLKHQIAGWRDAGVLAQDDIKSLADANLALSDAALMLQERVDGLLDAGGGTPAGQQIQSARTAMSPSAIVAALDGLVSAADPASSGIATGDAQRDAEIRKRLAELTDALKALRAYIEPAPQPQ